jgi:DNA-binding IclR family transcriptional regulator
MTRNPNDAGSTEIIRRAFLILEALREVPGSNAVEIAEATGGDSRRIVATLDILCEQGYVVAVDGGCYVLAYRMTRFADDPRRRSSTLRMLARPHLEAVTREVGETANLLVLEGREAVYVDQVKGDRGVQVHQEVGRALPLHATASGKVLVAHRSDWRELVGSTPQRYTETTITDLPTLESELRRIRRRGYAVEAEENEAGVRCVAGPIMNGPRQVAATVSVSAPTQRIQGREHDLAKTLQRHALHISNALGYAGETAAAMRGAM